MRNKNALAKFRLIWFASKNLIQFIWNIRTQKLKSVIFNCYIRIEFLQIDLKTEKYVLFFIFSLFSAFIHPDVKHTPYICSGDIMHIALLFNLLMHIKINHSTLLQSTVAKLYFIIFANSISFISRIKKTGFIFIELLVSVDNKNWTRLNYKIPKGYGIRNIFRRNICSHTQWHEIKLNKYEIIKWKQI